jgi:hypothetical protein
MTFPDLLTTLDTSGVHLTLRLLVDAPVGVITHEIKAALIEHKSTILVRLAREADPDDWSSCRAEVDRLQADGLTRADALRHAYSRRFKVDPGPIDPATLAWLSEAL